MGLLFIVTGIISSAGIPVSNSPILFNSSMLCILRQCLWS
jgi:hypothetical protein